MTLVVQVSLVHRVTMVVKGLMYSDCVYVTLVVRGLMYCDCVHDMVVKGLT